MSASARSIRIKIPQPHPKQAEFVNSTAKRIVVKAGRRGGKTKGFAIRAVKRFLQKRRQIYAAPTARQLRRFWTVVCRSLAPLIEAGVLHKNETEHIIEFPGTDISIQAMTAWNPATLRGDWCHDLYLDEYQLMAESTWDSAGAPLLADVDGDAVFGFTPPSLHSEGVSKADDPHHATKFYKKAKADTSGRAATFHFSSHDNPHISEHAIRELAKDMTAVSYRIEILAEDIDQAPGALWTRDRLEASRRTKADGDFSRVVVAIDPSTTTGGDEAGIITAGRVGTRKSGRGYVIADDSLQGSPKTWAQAAVTAYYKYNADCIVAEDNNGGEMVELTIATVDADVRVIRVHASRGKATRAEPVSALFEVTEEKPELRGFLCGSFPLLEDELCLWQPGENSPNRLDAMVWAFTELLLENRERYDESESETWGYVSY
jgi:phage terminase large subunit-like protein